MGGNGTVTVDFGTSGNTDVKIDVTGLTSILSNSSTGAWIAPAITTNNGIDEHWVEDLYVYAGPPTAGVGFTVYVRCNTGMAFGQYNVAWVWV